MKLKLNKESIRNILTIRYNPLEKTMFKKKTWQDFRTIYSDSHGRRTELLLKKSIQKSLLKKKGPICVSLSSGIDSSLSLALLRKVFPNRKIVGICAVFDTGFDESKQAKKIASKFDADFKIIHIGSMFRNMPELISIAGKPRWNTYTHFVAKEARKMSKILVTGDGADELFGGYTFRYKKFLTLHRPKDNWKIKTINYLECHNRDWVPDQEYLFGSSIKFNWNVIYNFFKQYFSNPLEPLQQVMLADFNGKFLFDFLPTNYSIYNQYGISGNSIFLESELMDFVNHFPVTQKYNIKNNQGKLILRKIAKRLEVAHIDEKRGFSPSLLMDWNIQGRDISKSFLLEKNSYIYKNKLINYNWVIRAFERIDNDNDIRYLNRIISILALEIWYRIFITNELNKTKKLT